MIEILHRESGEILFRLEVETTRGAHFFEAQLAGADLRSRDLIAADFTLADLGGADLCRTDCLKANFYSSRLRGADLTEARLAGINGEGADLRETNLTGARLYAADLRHASLTGAILREADLAGTVLMRTQLIDADLTGATLNSTVFANCVTLHRARGLADVKHGRPSSLDQGTLRACVAYLPDVFLYGVGYNDEEIRLLRALYPKGHRGR